MCAYVFVFLFFCRRPKAHSVCRSDFYNSPVVAWFCMYSRYYAHNTMFKNSRYYSISLINTHIYFVMVSAQYTVHGPHIQF